MYCPDPGCKEQIKKYEDLNRRVNHLQFAAEDYDRQHGKGAFRKKFKEEATLLDSLQEQKIKMAAAHAKKTHTGEKEKEYPGDATLAKGEPESPVPVY